MKPEIPFTTVALVGRAGMPGIRASLLALAQCIRQQGLAMVFETETAATIDLESTEYCACPIMTPAEIGAHAEVAVVLGGDGTMLGIGRQLAHTGTPLIGIHGGRLGFMTNIQLSEIQQVMPAMLAGQFERDERTLLEAEVLRSRVSIYQGCALNDVVVHRDGGVGLIELRVAVNSCLMYTQRADGLIIATPTGSTAYALSSYGPILHPQLAGMVLVPIAPHTLSNRPIVLPDSVKITVQIIDGPSLSVNCDTQSFTSLQCGDVIEIQRAPYTVPFLHPVGHSYYATLRQKLHWNAHTVDDNQCYAV
jgi:NAD+ kinase